MVLLTFEPCVVCTCCNNWHTCFWLHVNTPLLGVCVLLCLNNCIPVRRRGEQYELYADRWREPFNLSSLSVRLNQLISHHAGDMVTFPLPSHCCRVVVAGERQNTNGGNGIDDSIERLNGRYLTVYVEEAHCVHSKLKLPQGCFDISVPPSQMLLYTTVIWISKYTLLRMCWHLLVCLLTIYSVCVRQRYRWISPLFNMVGWLWMHRQCRDGRSET